MSTTNNTKDVAQSNAKHTSVIVGSIEKQKQDVALANKEKIHVDSKTATEASQALAISDKKEQAKKIDITSNEHSFLTWFLLLLQKLLETTTTTHGMRLESKPYMILFDALKKQGYSLKAWGALNGMGISKTMNYSTCFPVHVDGKTKLVSGSVIYNAIKNNSTYKIFSADKKRYLHYVNNCFYVFHVTTALDKQQEVIELKKIEAIDNVKKEQEKSVVKKEETKK